MVKGPIYIVFYMDLHTSEGRYNEVDMIHSPWIPQYVSGPDTQILKVTLRSGGIHRATWLTRIPAFWVRVMSLLTHTYTYEHL